MLFLRREKKLKVDLGELSYETEALSNFLSSKLKTDVALRGNEVVGAENLSVKELERLVNKFVYHQNLMDKYWVGLKKGVVQINRFENIAKNEKLRKTHTHSSQASWKTSKIYIIAIWMIMLTVSLSLIVAFITFFQGSSGRRLTSTDWGGYVAVSNTNKPQPVVVGVSGSWTVPQVSVSQTNTYSSAWIGIGGYVDQTLIQTGTTHDSINGIAEYSAWFELIPNYSATITTMTVSPGDKIVASINLVDTIKNEWAVEIVDETSGQRFKQNFVYNSSRLSAEWIVEKPTINGSLASLADFGSITFTDSKVTMDTKAGTISDFPFSQFTMYNRQNTALVTVSSLFSNGTSFTIKYSK